MKNQTPPIVQDVKTKIVPACLIRPYQKVVVDGETYVVENVTTIIKFMDGQEVELDMDDKVEIVTV